MTEVTSTRSTSWHTLEEATAGKGTTWHVFTTVTVERLLLWDVYYPDLHESWGVLTL